MKGFTLRILSKFPIVESTSWVLLGIRDIKNEIKEEIVAKGAEWLKDNRNLDHIANLQNYDSIELHSDVLVLKGKFSLERRLQSLIDLTLIFMKKYWAEMMDIRFKKFTKHRIVFPRINSSDIFVSNTMVNW